MDLEVDLEGDCVGDSKGDIRGEIKQHLEGNFLLSSCHVRSRLSLIHVTFSYKQDWEGDLLSSSGPG